MLVGAAILGAALWLGLLDELDERTLDGFFGLRGPRVASSPIVVIVYDDETLKLLRTAWPPPRSAHAALLRKLNEAPPAVVGFDLVFADPSSRGPRDDDALATALRDTRGVVLASYLETTSITPGVPQSMTTRNRLPLKIFPRDAVGHTAMELDGRDLVRRMTLFATLDGERLPSLGREVARVARRLTIDDTTWEDLDGGLINFRGGAEAFRYFTYQQIVNGAVGREEWRDKIVLIGAAGLRRGDWRTTSFSRRVMPGVLVHANIVDGLLADGALKEPSRVARFGIALAETALVFLVTARSPVSGVVLGASTLAATYLVSYVLLVRNGWWIAPTVFFAAVMLGLLSGHFASRRRTSLTRSRGRGGARETPPSR